MPLSIRSKCSSQSAGSGISFGIPLLRWSVLSFLTLLLLAILGAFAGCDLAIPEKNRTLPFAPASFEVPVRETPLHVLVLGDFGWGGRGQAAVAQAIADLHGRKPFHFGITVGDNFYNRGVGSARDPKWAERWEKPYGSLGIRFFPTLGNHDYYGDVQAQLDYRSPGESWQFPARQYHFRVGNAHFVALDTMDPNPEQLRWLDGVVGASQSHWIIVYGHHPVYSAGKHGDHRVLVETLLPVLRGRAAMYVAGHDHDMQHLEPVDGTHFFVSGGGGAKLRDPKPHPRTIFAKAVYGFTTLAIHPTHVDVTMYDSSGIPIYQTSVLPPRKQSPLPPRAGSVPAARGDAAVTAPALAHFR